MRKSIWEILDEMASGVEYVTQEEVISAYYMKSSRASFFQAYSSCMGSAPDWQRDY